MEFAKKQGRRECDPTWLVTWRLILSYDKRANFILEKENTPESSELELRGKKQICSRFLSLRPQTTIPIVKRQSGCRQLMLLVNSSRAKCRSFLSTARFHSLSFWILGLTSVIDQIAQPYGRIHCSIVAW